MTTHEAFNNIKPVGDITSISILLGTLVEFLPSLAALLTVVWTCIRIYETDTIQKLVHRKRKRK